MTEYDYSPEAYERHIAKQHSISKWVSHTSKCALQSGYSDPFEPPSRYTYRPTSPSPSISSASSSSASSSASSSVSEEPTHRRDSFRPIQSRSHTLPHPPYQPRPSQAPRSRSTYPSHPSPSAPSPYYPSATPVIHSSSSGTQIVLPPGQQFVIYDATGKKINLINSPPPSPYPYPPSTTRSQYPPSQSSRAQPSYYRHPLPPPPPYLHRPIPVRNSSRRAY